MRALYGVRASQIATAYCDRRIELGLPALPVGALLGQAMRLLDSARWEFDTLLAAAVEFAGTRRFPGYFEEWASEYLTTREIAAHEQSKADSTVAPDVLALIAGSVRRIA